MSTTWVHTTGSTTMLCHAKLSYLTVRQVNACTPSRSTLLVPLVPCNSATTNTFIMQALT